MTTPASAPSDGRTRVDWVPTIADPAAPSAAILNGASTIQLAAYLTPDGYAPADDESVIADQRLSSTEDFERPGRVTSSLALTYIYRGQDGAAADNKAWTTLKKGTAGFIVVRRGKTHDTAYAAADVVTVYPVTCGVQMEAPPEANSIDRVSQKMFVTGTVRRQVAVVA